MKKRILFLANKYQREKYIVRFIVSELQKDADFEFEWKEVYSSKGYNRYKDLICYKPEIIWTFPITNNNQVLELSVLKYLYNPIIMTYTTEGVWDFDNQEQREMCIGYYDYSCNLIDYQCYWGTKLRDIIGTELINRGRMKNNNQLLTVGYPLYDKDKYLEEKRFEFENKRIKSLTLQYHKTVMVVTGFHCGWVTKEQVKRLPDVINQHEKDITKIHERVEDYWKILVLPFREFQEKYIDEIVTLAKEDKNVLFLVRMHPLEKAWLKYPDVINPYTEKMGGIENIHILKTEYPIGLYLNYCDLFIHYGSTTGIEAYLYNIPTIQLLPEKRNRWLKKYFESTIACKIDEHKIIHNVVHNGIEFKKNDDLEKYLYEVMGVERNGVSATERCCECIKSVKHQTEYKRKELLFDMSKDIDLLENIMKKGYEYIFCNRWNLNNILIMCKLVLAYVIIKLMRGIKIW